MDIQPLAEKVYTKFKTSGIANIIAMEGRSIADLDHGISGAIMDSIEDALTEKEYAWVSENDYRWDDFWAAIIELAYWDPDFDDVRYAEE